MTIAIYITSAIFTNFVFSLVSTLLFVYGVDKSGGDPGSPGIMLFGLLCIYGLIGVLIAAAMEIAKVKYQKVFPAKFSALIFLFTYFPNPIIGSLFTDAQLGSLAAPLGIVTSIMQFLSYIPFFHMTAQGLFNLNKLVERQEVAGNRYLKFLLLALLGAINLYVVWRIYVIFF